jgi:hypothetical protein
MNGFSVAMEIRKGHAMRIEQSRHGHTEAIKAPKDKEGMSPTIVEGRIDKTGNGTSLREKQKKLRINVILGGAALRALR